MPYAKKTRLNAVLTLAMKRRRWAITFQTIGIAAACWMLFAYARDSQNERIQLRFETEASRVAERITEKLNVYHEVVRSIASFYAGSGEVSRSEFNSFVGRALTQHDGIHALEWVPRVSADDRLQFEDSAKRHGFSDFQFKRLSSENTWMASHDHWADEYFPVFFVQPHVGNEAILGIDLASSPKRRAAMELARDTGQPVATAGISLVQEVQSKVGFLLFVPVFANHVQHDQIPSRRRHLLGYALGVFRFGDIVDSVMQRSGETLTKLVIIDTDGRTLYTSSDVIGQWVSDDEPHQHATNCTVGGRIWDVRFAAKKKWVDSQRTALAVPIAIAACLLALLMGALLHAMIDRTASVERLVWRRTEELEAASTLTQRHSDELAAAKHVLEQSNQQLKEFAYAASHDLQTPLRGIANFAAFLQEEYRDQLDDTANGYINRIVSSADRMKQLILDLLEYSRVESKSGALQPTNLNDIFDKTLALLESEIEDAAATVTRDDLPLVHADPEQMSQLLRNLITNGLKYRGDKPAQIHVAAQMESRLWSVSVRDNGIGIDTRFQGQIFDIFRRLHTQKEYPGTGIGLALCRRIVQRHGGSIRVESVLDHGSAFTFTLPAVTRVPGIRGPKMKDRSAGQRMASLVPSAHRSPLESSP